MMKCLFLIGLLLPYCLKSSAQDSPKAKFYQTSFHKDGIGHHTQDLVADGYGITVDISGQQIWVDGQRFILQRHNGRHYLMNEQGQFSAYMISNTLNTGGRIYKLRRHALFDATVGLQIVGRRSLRVQKRVCHWGFHQIEDIPPVVLAAYFYRQVKQLKAAEYSDLTYLYWDEDDCY